MDPLGEYKYKTTNIFKAFLHEMNPFNLDGAFARQAISISDTIGAAAAKLIGNSEGAKAALNSAVKNSGQAILDESNAGKGAKVAYWGALGVSATAIATASGFGIAEFAG